jgi:SAM-dependent methyltransferase
MRNEQNWRPTKYRLVCNSLRSSTDPADVKPGSRLIVECVARFYDKAISNYASGRLVDLGCGNVPLYIKYKQYVSSITCVDWGYSTHKNGYVDIECDLTKKLPFHECSFDTIIMSSVLEHIPEPALLWAEIARILSPGGRILIDTPFYYPLHEIPHDYYRYSSYALRRFAESNGLEVLQLQAIGGSPEILADIIGKHLPFIPLIGDLAARFIQSFVYHFTRTTIGRKLSEKSSERFPLGYFMVAEKK